MLERGSRLTSTSPRQLQCSQRARSAPASPIRKLTPFADAAKARGTKVYHLNIGQPDLVTPRAVLDSVHRFAEPILAYAPSLGLPQAREAWSLYFAAHRMSVSPDQILVTVGGSEAIMFAIGAVADPGDNVIVFEPTYTNYCGFAAVTSVALKGIPLSPEAAYSLPAMDQVEAAIDSRTRAILVCNPNNPTGSVYDAATMLQFVDLASGTVYS